MRSRSAAAIAAALTVLLCPSLARASAQNLVRFSTSLGNIDVQLLPADAPKTVANFLGYVDRGSYANTIFHRSNKMGLNIAQGGGFSATADAGGGAQIQRIPVQPPVQNEFRDSNVRGTLAMALQGSSSGTDPNSGTDEWFFNVADDSAALDPQRFAVFGYVISPASLAVMDAIAALPNHDASSQFSDRALAELPVRNYRQGNVLYANLVTSPITRLSDDAAPVINVTQPASGASFTEGQTVTPQYHCDDGTGTGVKTCTGPAMLDTSSAGQKTFTVTATDYAGNSGTTSVSYTVKPGDETTSSTPGGPTARVTSPTAGRHFVQGQYVTTSFVCADSASTVSSCKDNYVGSGKAGELDTSSLGQHAYTVTATAADGKQGTATVTYLVTPAPLVGPVGVRINGGAFAANSPLLKLGLVWPAGATTARISADPNFDTAKGTATVTLRPVLDFSLPGTGGSTRPVTIFVRYLGAGRDTVTYRATILFDRVAPLVRSATLRGARGSGSVPGGYLVAVTATDLRAGLCAVQFASRLRAPQPVSAFAACRRRGVPRVARSFRVRGRVRPRFVRVRNSAGTWSSWTAIRS